PNDLRRAGEHGLAPSARPGQSPRGGPRDASRGVCLMATVGAVAAAADSGSRLGRGSKALVRLNGRTTLARVLELFLALDEVDRIVVVGPPSRLETAAHEVAALHPRKPGVVKAGGQRRQAA